MVSGEKKLLIVEQRHAAGGMARHRNGLKIIGKRHSVCPIHDPFRSGNGISVGSMDDPLRAEIRCIFVGIGNIVLMGEEDVFDSTSLLEGRNQMFEVAR